MKSEHKTIKRTLVGKHSVGRRKELKRFEFEKVKLQYDGDGSVQFETPYTQTLYLLVLGRKEVWLTEDQFDTLRFLVDMEREVPASPTGGEARIAGGPSHSEAHLDGGARQNQPIEVMRMSEQEVVLVQESDEHEADLAEDDVASLRYEERRNGGAGGSAPLTLSGVGVYRLAKYIETIGVEFDYQDVLELEVDGVLGLYHISVTLTAEEREHLQDVLLNLGERVQTREMTQLSMAEAPLLEGIRDRGWNFAREALLRKLFMAALRQQRRQREVTPLEYFIDLATKLGMGKVERMGACFDLMPLDPVMIPTGNATREEEEREYYARCCWNDWDYDDSTEESMVSAG